MVKLDGIIRLTEKFKRLAEVLTREPREGRTIINSSGGGFNSPTLDQQTVSHIADSKIPMRILQPFIFLSNQKLWKTLHICVGCVD
jgi:hypothetical protein